MKLPIIILLCIAILVLAVVVTGCVKGPGKTPTPTTPEEAFRIGDDQSVIKMLQGKIRMNEKERVLLYRSRARIAHREGRFWDAVEQLHHLKQRMNPEIQTQYRSYVREFLENALSVGNLAAVRTLVETDPETVSWVTDVFSSHCRVLDYHVISLARQMIDLEPEAPLGAALTECLTQIQYEIPSVSDGYVFFTADEDYPNVQGLCTDHENYIYIACRTGGNTAKDDLNPTMLRKIDRNGVEVASNDSACYCHANGMTYCAADGKLYISTLGRQESVTADMPANDPQQENVIAVVNSDTLEAEAYISLAPQIESLGTVYRNGVPSSMRIAAIHYNEANDVFICLIGPHYLTQEQDAACRGFAFFDRDWNLKKFVRFENRQKKHHAGSITTDEDYIYLSINIPKTEQKLMHVFDWDCNYIGSWNLNAQAMREFECADFIGTTLYCSFNTRPVTIEAFTLQDRKPVSLLTALEHGKRVTTLTQ